MNSGPNFDGQEIDFAGLAIRKHGGSNSFLIASLLILFGALLNMVLNVVLIILGHASELSSGLVIDLILSLVSPALTILTFYGLYRFHQYCKGAVSGENGLKFILISLAISYCSSLLSSVTGVFAEPTATPFSTALSLLLSGWILYYFFNKIRSSMRYVESALNGRPIGKISRVIGFFTCATFIDCVLFIALLLLTYTAFQSILNVEIYNDPAYADIAISESDLQYIDSILDQLMYFVVPLVPTAIGNLMFFRMIRKFKQETNQI